MKVYLAGPFFNKEQVATLESVEGTLKFLGYEVFSPRLECLCPPDAPPEQRKKAFDMNCEGIERADFVLARIDDFDPGTIWEVGYTFAVKKLWYPEPSPRLYAFTTVPSRGLNLMLAQSADGFLQGLPSVETFLTEMVQSGSDKEAKKWTQSVI